MIPPSWTISIARQAGREIDELPAEMKDRVEAALDGLPLHPCRGDIRKLLGRRNEYWLRVGEWQIIFRADTQRQRVVVTTVRPRRGAYQD